MGIHAVLEGDAKCYFFSGRDVMSPLKALAFAFWRLTAAFPESSQRWKEWKASAVLLFAEMCAVLSLVFCSATVFRFRLPPATNAVRASLFLGLFLLNLFNRYYLLRDKARFIQEFEAYSRAARLWGSVATFGSLILMFVCLLLASHWHR
jgi:hypothetical protein